MKFVKVIFLITIFIDSAFANENKPLVAISINPLYQIFLAIAGDKNNVTLIINPASSEHDSQFKRSDVELLSKAELIFYVNDGLEKSFAKLIKNILVEEKSFQISKIADLTMLSQRNDVQKNDLHLWLNPQNAVKIAEFMMQKLSAIDSKNAKKYQKNFLNFKKEIAKTEEIIRSQLNKNNGSSYVFYHDGYQYFEEYFGIEASRFITYDHEKELTAKDLREFDQLAKSRKVKCVFGEKYDARNSAKKLAKNYGLKFFTLDLIGSKEDGYNKILLDLADKMAGCN